MNVRITARYVCLIILPVLLSLTVSELLLRELFGLGNPVLYDNSPIYGFRPLGDRTYRRYWGATLRFNNLGLRSDHDWDATANNKILFLGDSVTYGGSSVDNRDLFSTIAVDIVNRGSPKSYIPGDAGVNAWGVENVHALVVENGFAPAAVYVITLPEADFYRGLTRLQGLPYFNHTPGLALLELWYYFCYLQNNRRYVEWQLMAQPQQVRYVVDKAVKALKSTDAFIKAKGWTSLMFISPSKFEVLGLAARTPMIEEELRINGVRAVWILDELRQYRLSESDRRALFIDDVHLTKAGHKLWGRIIGAALRRSLSAEPSSPLIGG